MSNEQSKPYKRPSRFGDISRNARQVGRVIAFLSREQLDFIDKISKDALFSTGKKLSRTEIIQAMVESIRKLDVSGKDVSCMDELEERINKVAKENLLNIAEELKKGKTDAAH